MIDQWPAGIRRSGPWRLPHRDQTHAHRCIQGRSTTDGAYHGDRRRHDRPTCNGDTNARGTGHEGIAGALAFIARCSRSFVSGWRAATRSGGTGSQRQFGSTVFGARHWRPRNKERDHADQEDGKDPHRHESRPSVAARQAPWRPSQAMLPPGGREVGPGPYAYRSTPVAHRAGAASSAVLWKPCTA